MKINRSNEKGIETIELALMTALIAIASIGAATFLGREISNVFLYISSQL